jgi:thioredoxin 1
MSLRHALLVTLLAFASSVAAPPPPYNETANALHEVRQAPMETASTDKPVLLIFGANWCEDCRALDAALKNVKNALLIASKFVVVKINVGNFDKNLALAAQLKK